MTHRYVTLLIVVAMLFAGLRLARVASESESGWEFIITQWQDAVPGFVGLGHTSIGHSAPSKQAHFWLSEVDRLIEKHPLSAPAHMGAAWVLDSPDIGFMQNYWRQGEFAKGFPLMGLELDEDAISSAKKRFRDECQERCLEMAQQATKLDATDMRWWRMRALLQFEGDSLWSGQDFEPRNADWMEVLDECKKHDPSNALYDYLAALQLWNMSASYDWPVVPDDQSVNGEWIDFTDD